MSRSIGYRAVDAVFDLGDLDDLDHFVVGAARDQPPGGRDVDRVDGTGVVVLLLPDQLHVLLRLLVVALETESIR